MKLLKNISFSCKDATLLSEMAKEVNLSPVKRFKLFVHLSYCKHCQKFVEQSKRIDVAMKKYNEDLFETPSHRLSSEFKDELQKKLDNGL